MEDLVFFSDDNIRNARKTICDLYHDDPWWIMATHWWVAPAGTC